MWCPCIEPIVNWVSGWFRVGHVMKKIGPMLLGLAWFFFMEFSCRTFIAQNDTDCHNHSIAFYSTEYPPMAFFLNITGRPIFLSCEYPLYMIASGVKVCGEWPSWIQVSKCKGSWVVLLLGCSLHTFWPLVISAQPRVRMRCLIFKSYWSVSCPLCFFRALRTYFIICYCRFDLWIHQTGSNFFLFFFLISCINPFFFFFYLFCIIISVLCFVPSASYSSM